jgi:POT family proton-dependent oligopeptide transporter
MPDQRHPRGLYTLFFTEMWERLSYYGMRALLILFMMSSPDEGGLGFETGMAAAIYGLYTAGVYLAALPGGWIADRLLGAQRAVWIGGIMIALGHFTLALPGTDTFFVGLVLIVSGTGLLKPNISALVGRLYPEGGARRDAGFTIFYMGINVGAFLGPIACSALGEKVNWHYGFAAAGVGMVLGLFQFVFTRHHLGEAGRQPEAPPALRRRDGIIVLVGVLALAITVILALSRAIRLDPVWLARGAAGAIAGLAVVYFTGVFLFGRLSREETGRVVVIGILFVASALFWAGYEQAGSSLNLFAKEYTSRSVTVLDVSAPMHTKELDLPAGWFQSVAPLFVIGFAPLVAAVWVRLAQRGIVPSLPAKFGWGLLLLATGFVVVAIGASTALKLGKVGPGWLIATYLFHVLGELLLSPVGLSSVTKLSPSRLVGQMMGVWFLGSSLGNLLAGLFAGEVSGKNAAAMPAGFFHVALFASVVGLLLLACAKPIRRLMPGIQ